MAFQLQRPILVGGLGLTFSVWLLDGLHPATTHLGGTVAWGAIALGSGFWWLNQQRKSLNLDLPAAPLDRAAVQKELSAVEALLNQLSDEFSTLTTESASPLPGLQQQLEQLKLALDRKQARLSIMGGKGVGKTALAHLLAAAWAPQPAVPTAAPASETSLPESANANAGVALGAVDAAEVTAADLVLFVTTGDLTEPEFQAIERLLARKQRVLLLFNKQDQYLPAERSLVLQQLRDRLNGRVAPDDIVAIAAQPASFKVRQHQPDGSVQERLEQPAPDILPLTERLGQILIQDGAPLILATVSRQTSAFKAEILAQLNQLRRDRALPLIEQSQWIAAATAFANPVPSLDLLATAAINTQLILDLGAIYQQKFSLQQAKTATGTLAELMVKLGLVELSSQAIAPLLKSNALTYIAGGLLQGLSAAYLTRVAALSLVAYFEEQSQIAAPASEGLFQVDRLTQKLKAIFQDNQRAVFLQSLVKQGVSRLTPENASALPNPENA